MFGCYSRLLAIRVRQGIKSEEPNTAAISSSAKGITA